MWWHPKDFLVLGAIPFVSSSKRTPTMYWVNVLDAGVSVGELPIQWGAYIKDGINQTIAPLCDRIYLAWRG